jgi:hypothetical protein
MMERCAVDASNTPGVVSHQVRLGDLSAPKLISTAKLNSDLQADRRLMMGRCASIGDHGFHRGCFTSIDDGAMRSPARHTFRRNTAKITPKCPQNHPNPPLIIICLHEKRPMQQIVTNQPTTNERWDDDWGFD